MRKSADPGARFVLNQVRSVQVTLTPVATSAPSPERAVAKGRGRRHPTRSQRDEHDDRARGQEDDR
ncbi:MAG: hypothetical protein U5K29_04700 [Acidimicrobiales bacterium]|nr:hypothetical protein [Acidimicrobiales bacterium]